MSRSDSSSHLLAVAAALAVTVLWSSSWVLIRFGLDDESLDPLTFAGLRYGLAATVLAGWTLRNRPGRRAVHSTAGTGLIRLVALGFVAIAITQGAQFVAIDNQPAATTSLVLSLTPLLVAGAAMATLGERPAAAQIGGGLLVVAGAWLYFSGDLGATVLGLSAAVVGLVANSGGSLMGRSANRRRDTPAVVVTTISMTTGAAVLLATGLVVEGWPQLSMRAVAIIAWLAVVNTAVAFTLWNWSLRRLTAVESAGINNMMLVQIAALARLFLDESPGLLGVLGLGVVTVGILLTQVVRRPA